MKVTCIDLCFIKEEDMVYEANEDNKLDFKDTIEGIFSGSLDTLWFTKKDIDKRVFIMLDGGEMVLLKDGTLVNACFRGPFCRVWKEDGRSSEARFVKKLLRKAGLVK